MMMIFMGWAIAAICGALFVLFVATSIGVALLGSSDDPNGDGSMLGGQTAPEAH